MVKITQTELALLKRLINEIKQLDGRLNRRFSQSWDPSIEQINDITSRLNVYLKKRHPDAFYEVENSLYGTLSVSDYTLFLKYGDYYLDGLKAYQREIEADIIQGGLLDKRVQEMTGFELKTLLLITLNEFRERQQP